MALLDLPEHEYTFKHALTHEVAYGSLLQERRRALHARLIAALEAFALAEDLGVRPLMAHGHLGLGKLYATIGRRAALSAAIALYRSMEMTFWLPQAEAALAEVEGL